MKQAYLQTTLDRLTEANQVLVTLTCLHGQLESLLDALHEVRSPVSPSQQPPGYASLPSPDLNHMLKKAGKGWFSWNTFELVEVPDSPHHDASFAQAVDDFSVALSQHRSVFPEDSIFFDNESGQFLRSSKLVAVSAELERLMQEVTVRASVFKKEYNRLESRRHGSDALPTFYPVERLPRERQYLYLLALQSSRASTDVDAPLTPLDEWMRQLKDKPLFRYRYQDKYRRLRRWFREEHLVACEQVAQESLECELLCSYARHANLTELNEKEQALVLSIQRSQTNTRLTADQRETIHRLIQRDIAAGRRVYVPFLSSHRKAKVVPLSVKQWAGVIAVVASIAQSLITACAMAEISGFSGAQLLPFLQAHPGSFVAVIAVFMIMLAVNFPLFNDLMTTFLGTLAKGRLLKRANGRRYSKQELIALATGIALSSVVAFGIAVVSFNGYQTAFAAILSSTSSATPVLALSATISIVYFLTTLAFGVWLTKLLVAHWAEYKKKFDRLFLKGRNKVAKRILFGLSAVLAAAFTVGSVVVGCLSMQTWLHTLNGQLRHISHTAFDKVVSAVSLAYYLVSRFQPNHSIGLIVSHKLEAIRDFFKQRTAGQIAAIMIIGFPIRVIMESVFFVATIGLLVARLGLEVAKVIAGAFLTLVSPIAAIGVGIVSAARKELFKEHFNRYMLLPQVAGNLLFNSMRACRGVFLYCLKRAGPLRIFYDLRVMHLMGSQAVQSVPSSEKAIERGKVTVVKQLGLRHYLGSFFSSPNVPGRRSAPVRSHVHLPAQASLP